MVCVQREKFESLQGKNKIFSFHTTSSSSEKRWNLCLQYARLKAQLIDVSRKAWMPSQISSSRVNLEIFLLITSFSPFKMAQKEIMYVSVCIYVF